MAAMMSLHAEKCCRLVFARRPLLHVQQHLPANNSVYISWWELLLKRCSACSQTECWTELGICYTSTHSRKLSSGWWSVTAVAELRLLLAFQRYIICVFRIDYALLPHDAMQSAVMRQYIICLSVCLSVHNI